MVYPHATPHHWTLLVAVPWQSLAPLCKGYSQIHWLIQVLWAYPQGHLLGAVIAIALGVTSLGMFYMPAFAFCRGLCIRWDYYFVNMA